jgi:2-oxoisovalerate dehydrogenase E1 component
MKQKRIPPPPPQRALAVGDKDWAAVRRAELLWMYQQMTLIRTFEEKLLALKDDGLVNGQVHTSIGQEAVAVGAALAVRKQDKFTGTHRAHHQYLAKALSASTPKRYDPLRDGLTDEMQAHVLTLLKEIMGLAGGCSGGRGGSMHLYNAEIGVAGTNAIVGGGVPPATGVAWADAMQGRDDVTLCFYGDGAVYQGAVHEACNLASLWGAPIIYAIENNHYAVATSRDEGCSASRLSHVASAYAMPGFQVSGMDPLSVKLAIEHILADRANLPCFLEIDTYRHYHHAGCIPGSAFGYRTKEEEAAWLAKDPLAQFEARLMARGISPAQIEQLREQARACVEDAAAVVLEPTPGRASSPSEPSLRIREELWPTADSAAHGMRDENVAGTGPFVEASAATCTREIKFPDAITEVTGRWLEQDPGVVVMGEEVCNMGGGAYGATKGLYKIYPGRVRNTPITEAGFCGLACGAAMNGMHPVVELMFSSFGLVAADQLFNQIGQLGHIYGGHVSVPLVCRTRIAAGLGYGAQHSMDPVALFAMFPGWRIFVPTTPYDYIGLFNAAMKLKSPTLMVEHQGFYGQKGLIPEGPPDHVVEPGVAAVRREGSDVTVLSYGWGVHMALEAAKQLAEEGLSAEVIDLRTVDDAGMDYETIGASMRKTGALMTVEEAQACNAIGPKLIRACEQRWFDYLDAPAASINALDIPLAVSSRMERLCLPNVERTVALMRKAAKREV